MRTYPVTPPVTAIGAVTQILNEVEEGRIIPTSTHALATHIVQTLCAHEWVVDYSGMLFMSNPPKRARHCLICEKVDHVIAHDERCMGECSKCQGAGICGDVGGYCSPCEGQCMSWLKPKSRTRPQYEQPYLVKETQACGVVLEEMCPICGHPTEDVAGGPCKLCWDKVD